MILATLGALWLTSCGALGVFEPDREWPAPSPALWEAVGPNGETVWLFGTVHSLPDGVTWRTDTLDDIIGKADLLMVEISNLEATDEAAEAFNLRAFDNPQGPLLDRVYPAERDELAASLNRAGLDADALSDTETWAVALQLGNALRCTDPANGVDRALLSEIDNAQSIESFEMQFRAFDALSDSAQAILLLSVVEQRDCTAGEERIEAWLTGDLGALEDAIANGFRGNSDLQDGLIDSRNAWFAERIVRYLEREPGTELLVAVGAGHMVGEKGLPALLAVRGYTVTRIQ